MHLVHLPKAPNLFSRSSLTFLLKFCLVFIHSSLIFLATGMPKMNFYRHRIFKCSFRAALLLLKIQRGGKKGTFLSKLRRKIWEKSLNQFTLKGNSWMSIYLIFNVTLHYKVTMSGALMADYHISWRLKNNVTSSKYFVTRTFHDCWNLIVTVLWWYHIILESPRYIA